MTISRRELMAGAGATAVAASIPVEAHAQRGPAQGDAATRPMLAAMAERLLRQYPENATSLGLDKGARAGLKARLTDRSTVGVQQRASMAAAQLARLKAVDRASLTPSTALDVDVVQAAYELAVEGNRFGFGDVTILNTEWSYRSSPYAVAQNFGSWAEYPDFLDSKHIVAGRADADAYLMRMEAYAANLDGETERLRRDAGRGVVAPSFLLDKTLRQMTATRAVPVARACSSARSPGAPQGSATMRTAPPGS